MFGVQPSRNAAKDQAMFHMPATHLWATRRDTDESTIPFPVASAAGIPRRGRNFSLDWYRCGRRIGDARSAA